MASSACLGDERPKIPPALSSQRKNNLTAIPEQSAVCQYIAAPLSGKMAKQVQDLWQQEKWLGQKKLGYLQNEVGKRLE